jgi:NAD(P) transhydrogenase subunit beta
LDTASILKLAYVVAAVLFILGLKNITHPRTAVRGNFLGALAMLLAIVVTLYQLWKGDGSFSYILIGLVVGRSGRLCRIAEGHETVGYR